MSAAREFAKTKDMPSIQVEHFSLAHSSRCSHPQTSGRKERERLLAKRGPGIRCHPQPQSHCPGKGAGYPGDSQFSLFLREKPTSSGGQGEPWGGGSLLHRWAEGSQEHQPECKQVPSQLPTHRCPLFVLNDAGDQRPDPAQPSCHCLHDPLCKRALCTTLRPRRESFPLPPHFLARHQTLSATSLRLPRG